MPYLCLPLRSAVLSGLTTGHTFSVFASLWGNIEINGTLQKLTEFGNSFSAILIGGAFGAVDSFFFISGFLGGFVILKKLSKSRARFHLTPSVYGVMLLHRYLRVTPLYLMTLLWWIHMTPTLAYGPFTQISKVTASCNGNMYLNMLYINNIIPADGSAESTCAGWTWYLADDFQFFALTPLLLSVYLYKPAAGKAVISALIIGCVVISGVASHNVHADITSNDSSYDVHLYTRPWTRLSPYLIGVLLAAYFYERENRMKREQAQAQAAGMQRDESGTRAVTYGLRLMYAGSGLVLVLFNYLLIWDNYKGVVVTSETTGLTTGGIMSGDGTWPQASKNIFNTVQRTFLGLGLAGVSHCFFTARGWRALTFFIEHPCFEALGKLSYGAYLWSNIILYVSFCNFLLVPL
jgi:peptidoglycan/LPS O-acetylase OafA/YrhL